MGMFDKVICDYPLPGTPPTFIEPGHRFQSKDTPDQYLTTYHIRDDGTTDIAPDLTDTIEFYTSNIEDGESVGYTATFIDGKLVDIRETSRDRVPALPVAELHKSKEELAELVKRRAGA